ncbi:helix-turn-helix domain-containing protein, partial [Streptomyces sp. NPDC005533]|uniref:helix-turn-helix domain-containing protein n=1 Tax=Streptomyces sp. NPDC005533 TaxID=3364723 RepID=UPI0036844A14
MRCRIILACTEGVSNKGVATRLRSTPQAVGRWRARFVQYRIAGLADMPRSGGPRTVTDEQVVAVVTRTMESKPKAATHWSTRSMAKGNGPFPVLHLKDLEDVRPSGTTLGVLQGFNRSLVGVGVVGLVWVCRGDRWGRRRPMSRGGS